MSSGDTAAMTNKGTLTLTQLQFILPTANIKALFLSSSEFPKDLQLTLMYSSIEPQITASAAIEYALFAIEGGSVTLS